MEPYKIALLGLAFAAISVGGAGAATLQSIYVSGIIAQDPSAARSTTIDNKGVFAPPGTDLAGKEIQILEQYEPTTLGSETFCGQTCLFYSVKAPSTHLPGSLLIAVTVGAVRHVYTPTSGRSNVTIGYAYPDQVFVMTADDAVGNEIITYLAFTGPVRFGASLPVHTIIKTGVTQTFNFQTADGHEEYLTFQAKVASH